MEMKKLNEDLGHIQIGRDKDVPIEDGRGFWFLWIYENCNWDAERITRVGIILERLRDEKVKLVFCAWHGEYKTNLFLMDKKKLIKRLEKMVT